MTSPRCCFGSLHSVTDDISNVLYLCSCLWRLGTAAGTQQIIQSLISPLFKFNHIIHCDAHVIFLVIKPKTYEINTTLLFVYMCFFQLFLSAFLCVFHYSGDSVLWLSIWVWLKLQKWPKRWETFNPNPSPNPNRKLRWFTWV